MSEVTNAAILKAFEEQSGRDSLLAQKTFDALTDLNVGVASLAASVKAQGGGKIASAGNSNVLAIIGVVITLMAALSTVGMVLINSQTATINSIVLLMEDDNKRDLIDAGSSAAMETTIREGLREVNTHFNFKRQLDDANRDLLRCEMKLPLG
jgi:hypothetical protein